MALALFGLTFLLHLIQMIYYKFWIMAILVFALAMEVVGFGTRWYSINNPYLLTPVEVNQSFIILAPVFIAAMIYIVCSRL